MDEIEALARKTASERITLVFRGKRKTSPVDEKSGLQPWASAGRKRDERRYEGMCIHHTEKIVDAHTKENAAPEVIFPFYSSLHVHHHVSMYVFVRSEYNNSSFMP